ncbi:hypothetical protein IDH09_01475 [Pelagibacterales bacterium SAG-MED28]|nr:hypothetical protein [Pelagibacterales bacterium SAG-MED28]
MKDQISVSDKTKLNIPIANFLVIVTFIISAVLGFSNLQNRITSLETQDQLMSSDLLKKAEQTPKNLEIYMLIEHNAKIIAKHQELLDKNIHSQVMINNIEKSLEKAQENIEYLKNLTRKLNGNSN